MTPDQYIELSIAIHDLESAATAYGLHVGLNTATSNMHESTLRIAHQKVYDLLDNITFGTKGA